MKGNENKIVKDLKEKGVLVILPNEKEQFNYTWDELGGYEQQKRDIEDTILLALSHSHVYTHSSLFISVLMVYSKKMSYLVFSVTR